MIKIILLSLILSFLAFAQADSSSTNLPDTSWQIKRDLIVDKNGNPKSELISYIFKKLESKSGGGKQVSKKEFLDYLKNPDSRKVYSKELIKYATPLSEEIQKKEHLDFTKIFMKEKRLNQGVDFIKKHFNLLAQAQKKYGVQIKDLVSILMWESGLGEFTGNYYIFNIFIGQILFLDEAQKFAVMELKKNGLENPLDDSAFAAKEKRRLDYRKKDAANSLISLLRYCKKFNIDPLKQKGSWGGAIGFVQFMPYNLQYAIDADSNGNKDLFSWPDAIMTAANFLSSYGKYSSDIGGRRKAIFRYNGSSEYVDGVILFADEIWKRFEGTYQNNNKNP